MGVSRYSNVMTLVIFQPGWIFKETLILKRYIGWFGYLLPEIHIRKTERDIVDELTVPSR